jgi:hypothetical protein
VKFKKKVHETDESITQGHSRRSLLLLGLPRISNGQDKPVPKPKKDSTVKENRTYPVCPPGGVGLKILINDLHSMFIMY